MTASEPREDVAVAEDAVAWIKRLVGAWDCCATCAGGVLAERDRERERAAAVEALRSVAAGMERLRMSNPMNGDGSNHMLSKAQDVVARLAGEDVWQVAGAIREAKDEMAAKDAESQARLDAENARLRADRRAER